MSKLSDIQKSSFADKAVLAKNQIVFDITRIDSVNGTFGPEWRLRIQYVQNGETIQETLSFDGKNEGRNKGFELIKEEISNNKIYQDCAVIAFPPARKGNNPFYQVVEKQDMLEHVKQLDTKDFNF